MATHPPVPAGDPSVEIVPFVLDVPPEQLADLHERLRRVRLPEPATDAGQGLGLDAVAELCRAWLEEHDWQRVEDELNRRGQFRTAIDGLGLHFLHVRSPRSDAAPLLVTHGWPGSVVEVLDVLDALTDPGDDALPAFHVVAPSLPGYGLSGPTSERGWHPRRMAAAFVS